MLTSVFSVSLIGTRFENILLTSISTIRASLLVESSNFIGSSPQGNFSDALILEVPLKVFIKDSFFSNFLGRSSVTVLNDESSFRNLYFLNNTFKDCRTKLIRGITGSARGGFINALGFLGLILEDCKFIRGYSIEEGGAISYECKGPLCSLIINGTSIFLENQAEKSGQSIFSSTTSLTLSNTSKIINIGDFYFFF